MHTWQVNKIGQYQYEWIWTKHLGCLNHLKVCASDSILLSNVFYSTNI